MITTYSIALQGLTPQLIEVEVSFVRGQPQLVIIGLPNRILTEAKERIAAAIQEQQVRLRARKTLVNLAPADLKKTDSYYELAIAVGLLKLNNKLPQLPPKTAFFGEFSLGGKLKPLRTPIPLIMGAKKLGFSKVVIPQLNAIQTEIITDIEIYPLTQLSQLFSSTFFTRPQTKKTIPKPTKRAKQPQLQLDPIAARVLSITVAGGHNLLLVGPPGIGKTTAIHSLAELLPPLHSSEQESVQAIYSLAQKPLSVNNWLRPFRSPHHSSSRVSLLGGGRQLIPGEISLAHSGILFLDELTEFSRPVLEALREPMAQHTIQINRNIGSVQYQAQSIVIGSCNPCMCGYYQSKKACRCSPYQIQQYRHRISGPLLDRFELQLFLTENYIDPKKTTCLSPKQIQSAFSKQQKRYSPLKGLAASNGKVPQNEFEKNCQLTSEVVLFIKKSATSLGLSYRNILHLKRIARTIADLENKKTIQIQHVSEALQYRNIW